MVLNDATRNLIDRVDSMELCARVGEPIDDVEIVAATSWREAMTCCTSEAHERYWHERHNQLTSHIHDADRTRYNRWNTFVEAIKAEVIPLLDRQFASLYRRLELPEEFQNQVRWDLVGACMAAAYADLQPPLFYTDLAAWYLRGHFPCGCGGRDDCGRLWLSDVITKPTRPEFALNPFIQDMIDPPQLEDGRLIVF